MTSLACVAAQHAAQRHAKRAGMRALSIEKVDVVSGITSTLGTGILRGARRSGLPARDAAAREGDVRSTRPPTSDIVA